MPIAARIAAAYTRPICMEPQSFGWQKSNVASPSFGSMSTPLMKWSFAHFAGSSALSRS